MVHDFDNYKSALSEGDALAVWSKASPGRGFEGAGAPRQPQCITLGRLAPRHYAVRRRPRCPRLVQVEGRLAETELRTRLRAARSSGSLSGPAIPDSPQAARPAVSERGIGAGGVSGCSGMPGSEKVQPARQSWRIQGGQDTVERHDGLNVVMEKIDQWEQENPTSNGREMIDDFRLRGSRTCRGMDAPLRNEGWRTEVAHVVARPLNHPNAPLSEGKALPPVVQVVPGNPHWKRVGTDSPSPPGQSAVRRRPCASPPRTPRRGAAQEGEEVEGATPSFLPLVRHQGGGGGARQDSPSPLPGGGRSLHSDPWREGRHRGGEARVGTLTTGGDEREGATHTAAVFRPAPRYSAHCSIRRRRRSNRSERA